MRYVFLHSILRIVVVVKNVLFQPDLDKRTVVRWSQQRVADHGALKRYTLVKLIAACCNHFYKAFGTSTMSRTAYSLGPL